MNSSKRSFQTHDYWRTVLATGSDDCCPDPNFATTFRYFTTYTKVDGTSALLKGTNSRSNSVTKPLYPCKYKGCVQRFRHRSSRSRHNKKIHSRN